ncbi:MAG: HAMP domain-containing protein [Clostridia bacterium]|nr:HAMP domain-containing protein [Clostridia bacterium]
MKRLSIKSKIMLFYTLCTTLIVAIMLLFMVHISGKVVDNDIKDNLVLMVEEDVDDVDFDIIDEDDIEEAYEKGETVFYLEDGHVGSLCVEEAYVSAKRGVKIFILGPDGKVLLGHTDDYNFDVVELKHGEITSMSFNETDYYAYARTVSLTDKKITVDFMLVGVVQDTGSAFLGATGSLIKADFIILPLAIVLSALVGYLITRALFKPIGQITETAENISKGDDLSLRIDVGSGEDELHKLAETYNTMLSRLQTSFESEKAFTSDSSHELRTPTAIISAQCEYALADKRTEEEYVDCLEVINRQSKRMNLLISQLLSFTRLEQGTQKINIEKLNFGELVEELCSDMEATNKTDITLKVDTDKDVFINADITLIFRMVTNLVSNAYRYGNPGGYINVSVKSGDGWNEMDEPVAVLCVEDNGIGIADSELDNIFRRFYKGDKSRVQDPDGETSTGLGLAFVQKIVQIHGGKIEVRSKIGEGSTFTVILPKA